MSYVEELLKIKPKRMSLLTEWFCEWLCLIDTITGILTICQYYPLLEHKFSTWYWDKKLKQEPI